MQNLESPEFKIIYHINVNSETGKSDWKIGLVEKVVEKKTELKFNEWVFENYKEAKEVFDICRFKKILTIDKQEDGEDVKSIYVFRAS